MKGKPFYPHSGPAIAAPTPRRMLKIGSVSSFDGQSFMFTHFEPNLALARRGKSSNALDHGGVAAATG